MKPCKSCASSFIRVWALFILGCFSLPGFASSNSSFVPDADNTTFRHEIIKFVRAAALHKLAPATLIPMKNLEVKWGNHYQRTNWQVSISLYHEGECIGHSHVQGKNLAQVLKQATELSLSHLMKVKMASTTTSRDLFAGSSTGADSRLRGQAAERRLVGTAVNAGKITEKDLNNYRFRLDFDYFPSRRYSLIEYQQQGLELLGNRVAVRTLSQKSIQAQLARSQAYLIQSMNRQWHGFFKFYDAQQDKAETLLRTVYSASSLYTLLKLYSWNHDPHLLNYFESIGAFILSNQIATGPNAGGYYYGYDPLTKTHQQRVVVGTAAKAIFALLEWHRLQPQDPKILTSAKRAGDYLLSKIQVKGEINPVADFTAGSWQNTQRQSLLYSGQVLSALSRLYAETKDKRYYLGAQKIARHFVALVRKNGPLLGDDYRPANSISSSWVLMSLIDFARVDSDPNYHTVAGQVAKIILSRQINNPEDAYNHGRYLDAMTASGNGWINEVMGTVYAACLVDKKPLCKPYYHAMLLSSRWLLQNSYTVENTFNIKNPKRAIGGFITNFNSPTVRTDAVCHVVNSLLALLLAPDSKQAVYLNVPERPLAEVLPLLRAGV